MKRRRTEELRAHNSTEELAFAAKMSLRESGETNAAKILNDITTKSPTRASTYLTALKLTSKPPSTDVSSDDALALIIDSKLSKSAYQNIRNLQKKVDTKFLPSYERVLEAKARCYPDKMICTEISAEVPLQSILDHTALRILTLQEDVIKTLSPEIVRNQKLIIKWGCDGSSGQSEYKQKFLNSESSDASIFLTSLVPLQLTASSHSSKTCETIIWKNPRPSSPRYCRPIHLQFKSETAELARAEEKNITDQIKALTPFNTVVDGKDIRISYELILSMVYGKVVNALTDTASTLRCHICNSTSKDFNDIERMIAKEVDVSKLCYGISSLHAWIRFFEFFLHLGYKLGIKKWQARSEEDKNIVKTRKQAIQKEFKTSMGLKVDCPKQGFGSSNDGNTARRFFAESTSSARILGVDEEILRKCYVILQVIASGFSVNVEKFREYCICVARRIVHLYPWYMMPTAVHKILIHGYMIIEWAPLPIGELSEEAQESRNKDIKAFRERFARKFSREKNLQDVSSNYESRKKSAAQKR